MLAVSLGLCSSALWAQTPREGPTPPGARWAVHSLSRPRPPVVDPGPDAPPVPPPSGAIVLFDGRSLDQWQRSDSTPARWMVQGGVVEIAPDAGGIQTRRGFGDIQLHIEWTAPVPPRGESQERGNSGVFLMGYYEVQILDSWHNETYADGQAASLYGQAPPLVNAMRAPGHWNSYDIVFHRPRFNADGSVAQPARATVLHNGVLVQDNEAFWGRTVYMAIATYQVHGDKLPISLQDHGNRVRFRNIWVRELE